MAIYAELADGRRLEFPDGTDPEVIKRTIKRIVQSEKEPEKGVIAAGIGSTKRAISTARTGLESLFSPEEAAVRVLSGQKN